MPQYRLQATKDAERLDADADAWATKGRTDVQRATNYVLAVVLFAASLFFAGLSAKLRTAGMRTALLSMGVVIFVAAAVWLATQPTSISV
jgi:predicted phage tail protein